MENEQIKENIKEEAGIQWPCGTRTQLKEQNIDEVSSVKLQPIFYGF